MRKVKTEGIVVSQNKITDVIFDIWIQTVIAKDAKAGQFVGVYPHDGTILLPRPLSICEVSPDKEKIRLVYRVAGKGTAEFADYQAGDKVLLLGVLGNGFPVNEADGKQVFLFGGGIGIPPLLYLAKTIARPDAVDIFLGYRDNAIFLAGELKAYGMVQIATEDGSIGTKGNVIDAACLSAKKADIIMACGPMPMLRAIKAYASERGIKAYLSLEERMACGVGACLGCVCKTTKADSNTNVHNARICTEGPVFEAGYVEL
ncbi:MAG: dihydroorotate dehydrogenase electron transfer subunit [Lachnospiraceae bacterium]|nr:dihydroorotate dehydrogenase electron transfer subunit [Lachnospiraceae bacterium]